MPRDQEKRNLDREKEQEIAKICWFYFPCFGQSGAAKVENSGQQSLVDLETGPEADELYHGSTTRLMDLKEVQNNGNQEVQWSPRFVYQ